MKKVILTGATGKLGHNIVKMLHKQYKIIALVRNVERAKRILPYSNMEFYHTDLSKLDRVKNVCNFIAKDNNLIYGIVNNAGVDIDNSLLDTSYKDLLTLINTNEIAPYIICKELMPCLINNGQGHIINISSNLASRTMTGAAEYSMTKAALESLTRSIAAEFGKYSIYCNTVIIGGMRGYMTKSNAKCSDFSSREEDYTDCKIAIDRIPLNRQGDFKEFSAVISFLLSEQSSYINGAKIIVDGGISSVL